MTGRALTVSAIWPEVRDQQNVTRLKLADISIAHHKAEHLEIGTQLCDWAKTNLGSAVDSQSSCYALQPAGEAGAATAAGVDVAHQQAAAGA